MPFFQTNVYNGFTETMSAEDYSRSDDLTINVWPSITDAVAWSADGEIAIAAADDFQLLIPKLKISEDAGDDLWELIRLRGSFFKVGRTEDGGELEQEGPLGTASASLGEEIGNAEVVRCEWTTNGVARSGRCGLLLHTSNLLLSFWAPEGRPRFGDDWQRRLIINHELKKYFEDLRPELKQKHGEDKGERLKEMVRIRTFTVNQPFTPASRRATSQTLDDFCLLAVSNDNNEVVILWIDGPKSEIGKTNITAVTHFSCDEVDEQLDRPNLDWTFEDYMNKSRFVQHLAWSPWLIDDDGRLRSVLAFATRSRMAFKFILLDFSSGMPQLLTEDYEPAVKIKKPWASDTILEWLPDLREGRYGTLTAVTIDKTFAFTVDLLAEQNLNCVKTASDEWSQLAGAISLTAEDSEPVLKALPHKTIKEQYVRSTRLDGAQADPERTNGLNLAIKFNRDQFDAKFSMRGDVLIRLWGFAVSPLRDFVVTSATFHPSNSPEYIIPADMSSRVIFQATGQDDFVAKAIQQEASTEAIALSVKWLVKGVKTEPEKKQVVWKVIDQLEKGLEAMNIPELDIQTASFKDILYTSYVLIRSRYEQIASLVLGQGEAILENQKQVIEHLARRVLEVPTSRYKDTQNSRLMLANLRRVLVLFNLSIEEDQGQEVEKCDICDSDIIFDDYTIARCFRGHTLNRCALTFLAIQAPGLCESCGICGKQYLKSSHVEPQGLAESDTRDVEMSGVAADRPPLSLPQLLSTACDKCVYCGGKFIG